MKVGWAFISSGILFIQFRFLRFNKSSRIRFPISVNFGEVRKIESTFTSKFIRLFMFWVRYTSERVLTKDKGEISSSSRRSDINSSASFFRLLFSDTKASNMPSKPTIVRPFSFAFFSKAMSITWDFILSIRLWEYPVSTNFLPFSISPKIRAKKLGFIYTLFKGDFKLWRTMESRKWKSSLFNKSA